MQKKVVVNMAQFSIVRAPDSIETQALGSCVGVVLFDETAKVAGMLHAMLPSIERSMHLSQLQKSKFVDSGLRLMLEKLIDAGGDKKRIKAKLAGGANMFPDIVRNGVLHIGAQNVDMAKEMLTSLRIPVIAEETGGNVGRTIILDTTTWKLHVRSALYKEKTI